MSDAPTPVPTLPRSWRTRLAGAAALAVGTGVLTLLPGAAPTASAAGLVAWTDCDELLDHYRRGLSEAASQHGLVDGLRGEGRAESAQLAADSSTDSAAPAAAAATGGAVGTGPTGTNLQEQGVDEPDTAKLAGGLLVAVAGGRLQVLRAGPSPALLSSLPLGASSPVHQQPDSTELLVDGARVLVVSATWRPHPTGVLGPTSQLPRADGGAVREPGLPGAVSDAPAMTVPVPLERSSA